MQIYYYTRTNRSQNIAQQLSEKYCIPVKQIKDDENWKGIFKFLKAGAMASSEKKTKISYDLPIPNEKIILVFPVWAGTLPPAIRVFLEENSSFEVTAITTSLGTGLKNGGSLKEVINLIGKDISINSINLK